MRFRVLPDSNIKIYKKLFSDCLHTQNLLFLLKKAPKQGKKSAQLEKNNYPVGKIKFPSWKIVFFQLGVFRPLTGRFPKNTYKAVFTGFVKIFSDAEVSLSQCLIPKPFSICFFLQGRNSLYSNLDTNHP